MEDKKTSSGSIKTFARIIFVIGVIFMVLITIAMIGFSLFSAREMNKPIIAVGGIVCALIICIVSIFLLVVEKAFLMSYAEIAEDMRDVRNILARRDSKT